MNIEEAIRKHAEWKVRFRAAISKKERLDAPSITRDDCCDMGKWLYGPGKTRFASQSEFQKAVARHKTFHLNAGRVAELINAERYGEAEAALQAGTPYSIASNEVGAALIALRRVAAL